MSLEVSNLETPSGRLASSVPEASEENSHLDLQGESEEDRGTFIL